MQLNKLNEHLTKVHKVQVYKCFQCKELFIELPDLKDHLQTTHSIINPNDLNVDLELQSIGYEQKFECSICKKRFGTKAQMKMHFNSSHGEIKVSCDLCEKVFSNQNTLRMRCHKRNVHNEKKGVHICNICGSRKKWYDDHLRVFHNT